MVKLPCVSEVRGHCLCKEMLVIPVDRVVDENMEAEEEEKHKR
jgi:hypothetical protein